VASQSFDPIVTGVQRNFAGKSGVIGAGVTIDGVSHKIGGILPAGFRYSWEDDDFFEPLPPDAARAPRGRLTPTMVIQGAVELGSLLRLMRLPMGSSLGKNVQAMCSLTMAMGWPEERGTGFGLRGSRRRQLNLRGEQPIHAKARGDAGDQFYSRPARHTRGPRRAAPV
jgi:hypothetical protein